MNNLVKALIAAVILGGIAFVALSGGKDPDPAPIDNGPVVETPTNGTGTQEPETTLPPRVEETIEVSGRVIDESENPLGGATVVIERVGGSPSSPIYTAVDRVTSTTSGSFSSDRLGSGRFRFTASLTGYPTNSLEVALAMGTEPPLVELVLTSGLTIEGVVRGPSGEPVPDADVMALTEHFPPSSVSLLERIEYLTEFQKFKDEPGVWAKTDAEGRYSIQGLEARDYRVTATAAGFGPQERRYVAAGSTGVDFDLMVGGRLLGMVTDESGAPIADADVRVFLETDTKDLIDVIMEKTLPPLDRVKTDASGAYAFDTLGGETYYRLVFNGDGFQPEAREKIVVTPGEQSRVDVSLERGYAIRGIVYDPLGQPLEGARCRVNEVGVQPEGPPIDFSDDTIVTDANGEFVFSTLREVNHRLVVGHDLYSTYVATRVQTSDEPLTIHLTEGCMIRGQVFEAATGSPIPGATVAVHDNGGEQKSGVSDANGVYEVRGISETRRGTTFVNVDCTGYERVSNFKVEVTEGAISDGIDFHLRRNGTVSGLVTDGNGNPLAGVSVAARRSHPNGAVVVNVGMAATTDAGGRFTIEQVQPGDATFLEGTHSDYLRSQSEQFPVAPGEELGGLQLVMRLGGSIAGRVIDESGVPIANATVGVRDGNMTASTPEALPNKVYTKADGTFVIRRLEAGGQSLLVSAKGFLNVEDNRHEVVEGQTTQGIEIRLTAGSYLGGMVVDQSGLPIIGARVTVTDTSSGMNTYHRMTDSNGRYLFEELGKYPVRVSAEAVGFSEVEIFDQPVNTENADIMLEAFGSIRGVVYDERGEPMRTFSVSPRIYDVNSGRPLTRVPPRTIQSPRGEFHFEGLEPGTYQVTIGAPAYAAAILEDVVVHSNQETVLPAVSLNLGGRISGIVYDAATGLGVPGATVTVVGGVRHFLDAVNSGPSGSRGRRDQVMVAEDGSFLIEGLKSNTVTLKIEHRLYMTEIYQEVRSGTDALEIPLSSGGTIEGIVKDSSGKVRPNVQILVKASEPGYDRRVVTDRRGNFSINALPTGIYVLRVSDFGRPNPGGATPNPGEAIAWEVEVIAGQTTVIDIIED